MDILTLGLIVIQFLWDTEILQFTSRERYIMGYVVLTRVEAGSNTSTVTLRVVGGDEKGSLESETVNYGHESYGTRTRK
jgi:hypothetical protein